MAMKKNDPSKDKGNRQARGPGEGPIYAITNYILWLFLSNFYFLLMNLPLLIVLLATSMGSVSDSTNTGINLPLMLASLTMGPATTALFSVMAKLIRENDLNVTRDFFKAYKVNFFQSLLIWAVCLAVLNLLSLDVSIAVARGWSRFIVIGIYLLMFYLCGLVTFALGIVSRFHLRLKDVIGLSISYSIRKPHITIGNLFCVAVVAILSVKNLSFLMLFIFSLISLGIMSNLRYVMAEIQEQLKTDM